MGFFKPADDAEESDEAPTSADEGAPGIGDETGTVGLAGDEGGDALADASPDDGGSSEV